MTDCAYDSDCSATRGRILTYSRYNLIWYPYLDRVGD